MITHSVVLIPSRKPWASLKKDSDGSSHAVVYVDDAAAADNVIHINTTKIKAQIPIFIVSVPPNMSRMM